MPIYEYRCKHCDRAFDLLRTLSQKDAPAACPSCGSEQTLRQLSVFAATISGEDGACGWDASANACLRPG